MIGSLFGQKLILLIIASIIFVGCSEGPDQPEYVYPTTSVLVDSSGYNDVIIRAVVNPNGLRTYVNIIYGQGSLYEDRTEIYDIGNGLGDSTVIFSLDSLESNREYYYAVMACNAARCAPIKIDSFFTKRYPFPIISPHYAYVEAPRRGSLPEPIEIYIWNGGGGQLVVYDILTYKPWLSVYPDTGSESFSIMASVETSDLPVGQHISSIGILAEPEEQSNNATSYVYYTIRPSASFLLYATDEFDNLIHDVRIVRYFESQTGWSAQDTMPTDLDGLANWYNILADTAQYFRSFRNAEGLAGEWEFWGYFLSDNIDPDAEYVDTINRVYPYSTRITSHNTNDNPTDQFILGDTVVIRIMIENQDDSTRLCQVRCQADQSNLSDSAEFDILSENVYLNDSLFVDFHVIPPSIGDYYARSWLTYTNIDGHFELTDSEGWPTQPLFTVNFTK